MKPVIYHFTNIAPLYRAKLWETLLKSEGFDFHYFFGENKSLGIKTIDFQKEVFKNHHKKLNPVGNFWIRGKYLVWQTKVLRYLLFHKVDLVILLGEFTIASNWFYAIICRIRGVHVTFRGHGMYGNERGLKFFLRKMFYRLADTHLLYERRAKKIMVGQGFKSEKIHVFFNSLDYDTHKSLREVNKNLQKKHVLHFFKKPEAPTFIFVGRLTKVKKIDMLVKAISKLNAQNLWPNLLIIGDGSERASLEILAADLLQKGTYHFYGACYDESELGKYLSSADLCVSPGNVGLTAIHSLSSGTPVCTHSSFENQMPEVEALEDGKTGIFFKEDDLEDMVTQIASWLTDPKKDKIRKDCFKVIDDYYNPYYQEKVIENLVNGGNAMI